MTCGQTFSFRMSSCPLKLADFTRQRILRNWLEKKGYLNSLPYDIQGRFKWKRDNGSHAGMAGSRIMWKHWHESCMSPLPTCWVSAQRTGYVARHRSEHWPPLQNCVPTWIVQSIKSITIRKKDGQSMMTWKVSVYSHEVTVTNIQTRIPLWFCFWSKDSNSGSHCTLL